MSAYDCMAQYKNKIKHNVHLQYMADMILKKTDKIH